MSIPKENISENEAGLMGDLDEGLKEIASRKFKPEDNPYHGTGEDPIDGEDEGNKEVPPLATEIE